jgi:hypothetical protein
MADSHVKRKILDAVQSLPEDVTFEDVIERVVFLAKVERGLAQADVGETVSHAGGKTPPDEVIRVVWTLTVFHASRQLPSV